MNGSIFVTIFAFLAYALFISGLFFVKKSDKKLNAVIFAPITFFVGIFFTELVASIMNITTLPVTLLTTSIFNLLMGALLWFFAAKKGRQKYYFCLTDLLCMLPIVLAAAFFSIEQFGRNLVPTYVTSDPGVHLSAATELLQTKQLFGMFFSSFINASAIEFFSPFMKAIYSYQIFVLVDVAMLLLSGLIFYCVTAIKTQKVTTKILASVISIFYMCGYPLCNMAFGFVYLGMSVTIILVIIFLTNCYINNTLNRKAAAIALMAACFALAVCYSLFVPTVYVGVFVSIALVFLKEKKLFTWGFVLEEIKIFLLPCFLAIYYFFIVWNPPSQAIAAEGFIYRNLFSNFVLLLTPVILGTVALIKKKENDASLNIFAVMVLWTVATLLLGLKGYVSSYYYFKIYYPMWAVCFYLAFNAVLELEKTSLTQTVAYLVTPVLLLAISFSGIENKIQQNNILFAPAKYSSNVFDIYNINYQMIFTDNEAKHRFEWSKRMELYEYAMDNCADGEKDVPLVDSWENIYWYEGLTGNSVKGYWANMDDAVQQIKDSNYVIVIADTDYYNQENELYLQEKEYLHSLEKVFENEFGFVAKVK